MPEVTINLDGHAEELAVFGSRDQYLRQIRDALGVKVLARHGEVRIEGEGEPRRAGPADLRGPAVALPVAAERLVGDVADLIEMTLTAADDAEPARRVEIREGNRVGPAALGRPGTVSEGPASRMSWSSASDRPGRARPTWRSRWRSPRCGRGGSRNRPGPSGRRGRRTPGVPAWRPGGEDQPLPAAPARRPS